MDNTTQEDFDGVFRFTNASDEDFKVLWNNKEYTFPAGKCSPILIANETNENIQEIRKKFAKKFATREFYKSDDYKLRASMGNTTPATYDEDAVLAPWIQQCLKPLPIAKAIVKELPKEDLQLKGSKAVTAKDGLNETFKDAAVTEVGKQSDVLTL